MSPFTFLTKLVEYLKLYTYGGETVFGDNVFLIHQFSSENVTFLGNPSVFVMDNGAASFPNNPRLLEQYFSVGFFLESVDRFGDQVIREALTLETHIIKAIRELTTLNSEKVLITENHKQPIISLKMNRPGMLRYWNFTVIVAN